MRRSLSSVGPGRGRLLVAALSTLGVVALCVGAAPAHADDGALPDRTGRLSSTGPGTRAAATPDLSAPDIAVAARPSSKPPKSKGTTKTLVVQIYWDGVTSADNRTFLTKNDLVNTNTWFRTVSHGKYGVTGTVTPPLHVGRLACDYHPRALAKYKKAAYKAAAHAGYKPKHYQRVVVSLPCPQVKESGVGQRPGTFVWLYQDSDPVPDISPPTPAGATTRTQTGGARSTWWAFADWKYTWPDGRWATQTWGDEFRDPVQVPTHEMGHNLGLQHAHLLQCSQNGVPTSFAGSCKTINYGDTYDTMGGYLLPGSYNAASLHWLHWLPGKVKHVKRKATVTLSALEGTGGTQAITVPGKHGRTYWIELRTRTGVDAPLDPAQTGVLIHYTKPHSTATWLIDALPGSSRAWNPKNHVVGLTDREQAQLLPGHTLKAPGGVTITTVSQAGNSAVVQVSAKHHGKHHHKHRKHKHGHKKKHHKKHHKKH